MRGYIFILLCLGTTVHAATLTATLKPGTIKQGDSAILTVRCEGYELATVDPERTPSGMGFSFRVKALRFMFKAFSIRFVYTCSLHVPSMFPYQGAGAGAHLPGASAHLLGAVPTSPAGQ